MPDGSDTTSPGPDADAGSIRRTYDWAETIPSMAVLETVASAADVSPMALDALYRTVDPDALNALVESASATGEPADATISFTFADHLVTLHDTGDVVVHRAHGPY